MKSKDDFLSRSALARAAMVDSQLRPQGVIDPAVLAAMGAIAREDFVPATATALSYSDRAVPLGDRRAMMPPAPLALLIQALAPQAGQRALVVGAGSGYSAAVLARLGVAVTALESAAEFGAPARSAGVDLVDGKLASGHAEGAPYDLILIDGAVEHIPDRIVSQLSDGGRLAAAIVDGGVSRLVLGTKSGDAFGLRGIGDAAVPPLPGFSRPRQFAF